MLMHARTALMRSASAGLPITFVGSVTGSTVAFVTDVVMTLPAGTSTDDTVLVMSMGCNPGGSQTGTEGKVSTSGYTSIEDNPGSQRIAISYKRMGVSPDTTVTIAQCSGGSGNFLCAVAMVFRSVNLTVEDVTHTVTSTPISSTADNPAITPANNGCCVVACLSQINRLTSPGTVSGYSTTVFKTNDATAGGGTASNNQCVAIAYKILSGGAGVSEDPGAWSSGANANGYFVATIALRPASVP